MNNEENKNQELNYDFNFDNQVVKEQAVKENDTGTLNDVEELEELEEVNEINSDSSKIEELEEVLDENEQPINSDEKKEEDNKKIKLLGKEFNFEDIILLVIGLVIVASIFLLPRIMNIFN